MSNKIIWTNEKIELLKKLYKDETITITEIKNILGSSESTILRKAAELGLVRKKTRGWTEHQIELLKKLYTDDSVTIDEISAEVNKSVSTILAKVKELKLYRKGSRGWTEEQVELLKKYYEEGLELAKISPLINKSTSSITIKIKELNLRRKGSRGWTKEQDDFIKEYYPKREYSIQEICEAIGRSESALYDRLSVLKLKDARKINTPEGFKYCSRCKNILPYDDFYKRRLRDGLSHYCKSCESLWAKQHRNKNKNKEDIVPKNENDLKKCSMCGEEKKLSDFYKVGAMCKKCRQIKKRERILKNIKEKGYSNN